AYVRGRRAWRLLGGAEPRFEAVSQPIVEAGEEVAVPVEREPDGRVPEALLDLLRVGALGDEDGRTGVPEVVKSQRFREPGVADGRFEVAAVEVPPEGLALRRAEYQPRGGGEGGDVPAQHLGQETGE